MAEERDAANGTEEPGDGPALSAGTPRRPRGLERPGAKPAVATVVAWCQRRPHHLGCRRHRAFPFGRVQVDPASRAPQERRGVPVPRRRHRTTRGTTTPGGVTPCPARRPIASPENDRRRRRSWGWPAALVAAVVVAGGAGAGIALAVSNNGGPGASKSGALPHAAGNTPLSSNAQPLNVHSIASHVAPATVDITAKGANGQDEGTGMIITSSGVVLTNNHVIDGSTQITVQVDGKGPTYQAAVLGTDAEDDVALLQLEGGSNFSTVALGNSGVISVGDPVVAIGNALGLPGPKP